MEFGPLFRAMKKNKTALILISLEVAVTLAIVVNAFAMIEDLNEEINRPTGIAESQLLTISSRPFDQAFREENYFEQVIDEDLAMLRSLPGVIDGDNISAFPLSGSGSSSSLVVRGDEKTRVRFGHFTVSRHGLETLGLNLVEGRNFTQAEVDTEDEHVMIVTRAFADQAFPDGNALGSIMEAENSPNFHRIIGIVEKMMGSWPGWSGVERTALFPGKSGGYEWGNRYVVRTEPGKGEALIPVLEEKLLAVNSGRNVRIRPLVELKAGVYRSDVATTKILTGISVILILTTMLGITGLTTIMVGQRTKVIGIRRALGARRVDILRYFLVENWLMTSTGLFLGIAFTYALNRVLMMNTTGTMVPWYLVVAGMAALWGLGLSAVFFPALRASNVDPAVASRSV